MEDIGENVGESKAIGSGRRWFAVCEDMFDHPVVGIQRGSPDKGEDKRRDAWPFFVAWQWLIKEAAWRERITIIQGVAIRLQRGQICHSQRHLAEKFNWGRQAVREFLGRLSKHEMVKTRCDRIDSKSNPASNPASTVISIVNYDTYQMSRMPNNPPHNPATTQQQPSNNPKRYKDTRTQWNTSSSLNPIGLNEEEGAKPEKQLQLSTVVVDTLRKHVGQTYADELVEKYLANPYAKRAKVIDKAFQGWLRKTYGIVISLAGSAMPSRVEVLDLCPKDGNGRPVTELPKTVSGGADDWKSRGRALMNGKAPQ